MRLRRRDALHNGLAPLLVLLEDLTWGDAGIVVQAQQQVAMDLGVGRGQLEGLAVALNGFCMAPLVFQRAAEVGMANGRIGLQPDELSQTIGGLRELAGLVEHVCEAVVEPSLLGLDLKRLSAALGSLVEVTLASEQLAELHLNTRVIGLEEG